MTAQRINMITLAVSDLQRAVSFYEALGFTKAEATDKMTFFELNGQYFGLYLRDALEADINRKIPQNTGSVTLAINYPDKASTDAAYQAAIDAGAIAITQPEEVFWGGYSGYYSDPDGHMWEVAFNPFWTLDENGMITF